MSLDQHNARPVLRIVKPSGHCVVDGETYSLRDLRKCGAVPYALDSSTGVWCVAYAADDQPVRLWLPGEPVPEAIAGAEVLIAHNAPFERAIFQHVLTPHYGWPLIPVEKWRCTMVGCLALALPPSLKRVAEVLGLASRKADDRVMHLTARPRRPRVGEDPNGTYWFDDAEHLEALYAYCKQDVEVERELWRWLSC